MELLFELQIQKEQPVRQNQEQKLQGSLKKMHFRQNLISFHIILYLIQLHEIKINPYLPATC